MAIRTAMIANVKYNGASGTAFNDIQSATLTINGDTYESTGFGDSWKEYVAGCKGWSLAVTLAFDNTSAGFIAMASEFTAGDSIVTSLTMYVTASCYFQGDSLITGQTVNVGVNAMDTYAMTFIGNGALAYTAG